VLQSVLWRTSAIVAAAVFAGEGVLRCVLQCVVAVFVAVCVAVCVVVCHTVCCSELLQGVLQ